jgi:formylglycine-generating enzyme required for sulfatase activity
MTGNVWEWCTNFKPSSHVFWGGYWLYSANSLRVAGRHYYFPAGTYGNSLCVRIPCCEAVGVTKIKQMFH